MLSITVAVVFSVYARLAPAVNTGVSFTAVTLIVEVAATALFAPLLSTTTQVIVRLREVVLSVGSSELERYPTERKAL